MTVFHILKLFEILVKHNYLQILYGNLPTSPMRPVSSIQSHGILKSLYLLPVFSLVLSMLLTLRSNLQRFEVPSVRQKPLHYSKVLSQVFLQSNQVEYMLACLAVLASFVRPDSEALWGCPQTTKLRFSGSLNPCS